MCIMSPISQLKRENKTFSIFGPRYGKFGKQSARLGLPGVIIDFRSKGFFVGREGTKTTTAAAKSELKPEAPYRSILTARCKWGSPGLLPARVPPSPLVHLVRTWCMCTQQGTTALLRPNLAQFDTHTHHGTPKPQKPPAQAVVLHLGGNNLFAFASRKGCRSQRAGQREERRKGEERAMEKIQLCLRLL